MNTYTFTLDTIDKTAAEILPLLKHKIVLFNGEMGAGKTTFIKVLLKLMKCEETVTSPTYSIVNEYSIPNDKVYHFDLYRIQDIEEALNFGIEDYLESANWVFIEWSERIKNLLPTEISSVNIELINTTTRAITINS